MWTSSTWHLRDCFGRSSVRTCVTFRKIRTCHLSSFTSRLQCVKEAEVEDNMHHSNLFKFIHREHTKSKQTYTTMRQNRHNKTQQDTTEPSNKRDNKDRAGIQKSFKKKKKPIERFFLKKMLTQERRPLLSAM